MKIPHEETRREFPLTTSRYDRLHDDLSMDNPWNQLVASEINELVRLFEAWYRLRVQRTVYRWILGISIAFVLVDIALLLMLARNILRLGGP